MNKALNLASLFVLACLALSVRAADQPAADASRAAVVKEWTLDGFKKVASTDGGRLATREFESEKPPADVWNAIAAKAGIKQQFKAGAIGGQSVYQGTKVVDFRYHSAVTDEDEGEPRVGLQVATLCIDTKESTIVFVLTRGKEETKTFISAVFVAK